MDKQIFLDDLGDHSSSVMHNITLKLAADIQKKKDKIITDRLKEIVGIDLNIKEEANRTFKRIAIKHYGNSEIVYFNDGSIEGKRIVTFIKVEQPTNFENDAYEVSVKYKYF